MMTMIILDPTDERVPIKRSLSARQPHLTGTVGLVDINKPRGNVLLARLAARLAERYPQVSIRHYRKPTFAKPAPADLHRVIASECDVVIEALAD